MEDKSKKTRELPLSRHPMYRGEDVDDARHVLSRMFTDVSVDPLDTSVPFESLVNGIELPRIAICFLRFDHGAVAGPVEPLDFHTIQLTHSGDATFNTQSESAIGNRQQGVMLSAGQKVSVSHRPDNSILTLNIKDSVLRNVISTWTGNAKHPSIRFALQFDPTQPQIVSLLSFIDTFVRELNRRGGILEQPAVIASFEDTLITSMLFGLEHNLSDVLRRPPAEVGRREVQLVEEYIKARAAEPIDTTTLARVSGTSRSFP